MIQDNRPDSPHGRFKHRFVAFFHPAYPHHTPPLLTLTANRISDDGTPGVDWDTARAACGIVACNRWDDSKDIYFAEKSEEQEPGGGSEDHPGTIKWTKVELPVDGILRVGIDFYFVIESPENRYPVVPNFDHWRFPHDALPSPWHLLPAPVLQKREDTCDVSGFYNTGLSHVPPFSHESWCKSNQMERYYRPPTDNEDPSRVESRNLDQSMALRYGIEDICVWNPTTLSVLHRPVSEWTRRVEMHPMLSFVAIIHQIRLSSPLPRCDVALCREHIFARFAFNVLSSENYKFLDGCGSYAVRLFDVEKGEQYTVELRDDEIVGRTSGIFPESSNHTEDEDDHFNRPGIPESPRSDASWNEDCCSLYNEDCRREDTCYNDRSRGRRRTRSRACSNSRCSLSFSWHREDNREGSRPSKFESLRMKSMLDIPMFPQRPVSLSSLSLPSPVSVSSFEPPHHKKTTGHVGKDKDRSDATAAAAATQPWNRKRSSSYGNPRDVSQLPKRRRLR